MKFLPVLLLFSVKLIWLQANASGNYTDYVALLKFKEGITSDPKGVLNSWNDSIPFCNWFGITCSIRHQRATSILLPDQNLVGSISSYIGNLSFLRVINLENNNFHGGIPREVGRLFRLQEFILRNSTIQGEIPGSIANCSRLRSIRFAYNMIIGTIPVELGSLQNFEILSLSVNNLSGKIPPSIGNISTLSYFSVGYNSLEGIIPETFGKLNYLIQIVLVANKLSGEVPPSIFNATFLNLISISQNQLQGTLPDNTDCTLPNLQKLVISNNRFSGTIPKSMTNCSKLEMFDIPENNFVGQVPADLGKLQSLSWINIARNSLGSNSTDDLAFLTSLTNCSNLQKLVFDTNNFGGTLTSSVANLSTKIYALSIGSNQISGTIPAGLENLVNLNALGLDNNLFTGFIPSYFGKFRYLQGLGLAMNGFSGEIPSSLGNLTQLVELYLFDNNLEGSIPSSIGNCQMLSYVDLSLNNLNGGIPKEILLLPSLSKALYLAGNMLAGELPPEVGKLTNLNALNIAENNLTGQIPGTIGEECGNLEQLYLQGNSFEGTISSSLVSIRGLRDLDLSRNNLSGQLPKDLESLPFLEYLNLSFNYLEGEVPTGGIFRNASAFSFQGNSKLCGGIPELQLPKCPSKTKGNTSVPKLVIIISCVVVSVLLIPTFLYFFWRRSLQKKSPPSTSMGERLMKLSYEDLHRATSGFSPDNLIGTGGFSSVYKGSLAGVEKPVAVKVLNLDKKGATKSFKAECRALRNIRHRNLVKLLTCCSSIDYKRNEFKALVYEFMPNGNLEKWLHSSFSRGDESSNLSILQRLNVAIDVASALHYLHDLCETPVVHCDLKPSNILLDNDDDMVAHLSDFGLAKLFSTSHDSSQSETITTGNKGTVGYAAPEYGTAAAASKKGDVYSYGIILLEMFTGRRPTDEMFKDGFNLHGFVEAALPERLLQIIDPSLLPRGTVVQVVAAEADDGDGIVEEEMNNDNHRETKPEMLKCLLSVLEIGLACSVESPRDRMNMMDVTRKLHLIKTDFVGTHRQNGRPGTNLRNN